MDTRKRLILYFSVTGAVGGAAVAAGLVIWLGVANASQLLFGLKQPILLVVIPILAASAAGFWASGAPIAEFGALRGAFLGALAFLSVVVILGLARGRSLQDSLMFMLMFIFFGFAVVGWATMVLGGFTGWLFRQRTKSL